MILEGRVCGLPLIFPLFLLSPQSSLQRKTPSRAEKEQGRRRERARKEELPTSIKKQEKDGWERERGAFRHKNQSGSSRLGVPAEEAMDSWQPTARTAGPQALADQQGRIWPQTPRGQTDGLSETNTECLSVWPLASSLHPAPPPICLLPQHTERGSFWSWLSIKFQSRLSLR